MHDTNQKLHPSQWKYTSPDDEGLHEVISPENSSCQLIWIFRLNLAKNSEYLLKNNSLELNGLIVSGKVEIYHDLNSNNMQKLDSFYLPAKDELTIHAKENCIIFIGGSLYEEKGNFYTRKYDPSLPLGRIRQVHGKTPYKRDVFLTVSDQDEASRLICGITIGEPGLWTSWPPHQHTKDLEETYCFFDIPKPQSAFHYSSRKSGEFEFIHPVSSGDCVIIPEGYHPTCGMPGVKSCYFWVMAAHRPEGRRYDLAVDDTAFGTID